MATMGGLAQEREVGESLKNDGFVAAGAIAAGLGDNVAVVGPVIDRLPQIDGDQPARFDSCVVTSAMRATLGAADLATLTILVEEADLVGGPFAAIPVALAPPDLVLTGGGGGTTEVGGHSHDLRLSPRKRFLRLTTTVDLSAGAADIASYGALLVLGGADRAPVT